MDEEGVRPLKREEEEIHQWNLTSMEGTPARGGTEQGKKGGEKGTHYHWDEDNPNDEK